MKNKLFKKTLIGFIIKTIVLTILMIGLFYAIVTWVNKSNFQWIYNYSPKIYYKLINFFHEFSDKQKFFNIFTILWLIGIFIILYRTIKKPFTYVQELSQATEKMLDQGVEYITLPKDLIDLEKTMNHLKRENEKNERRARENEQKKNDLVVYLAHDLKTPLTSMIGYLSLLDEIKDMPKKKREKYIEIALDKSYRLEELINELFDITRFNSEKIILEKEEINLNTMLEQIIDDFYPILNNYNKKVELDTEEKILLEGDPDKLARVFGNLIKNAIYYSTDSLIKMKVEKKDNDVNIIVSNHGKEISPDKLKRIFEKFYRIDSSRTTKTGGSGLGLAIAKEIVELHNGEIHATSNEKETSFYVKLPIKNK